MRRLVLACCTFAAALTLASASAPANIIYTFSNVTFGDGGALTGSFITNDARTSLVDFDITTTGALAFHYTPLTASSSSTSLPTILVLNTPPGLDHILQVTFVNLTPTGSLIKLGTFDSFEQAAGIGRRDITGGSVILSTSRAVPEPSSFVLAGVGGILLLGGAVRRRLRRA